MIQSFVQARKDIQHALVGPVLASVVTGPCGDLQILAHVQVGEDAAAFGYIGYSQPRYLVGCGACAVFSTYGNGAAAGGHVPHDGRTEEHTSAIQATMPNSDAVFCL